MLGTHYKITVVNTQNQAITVTAKMKPWKFASGDISYGSSEITPGS